jgi:hypothetical protein
MMDGQVPHVQHIANRLQAPKSVLEDALPVNKELRETDYRQFDPRQIHEFIYVLIELQIRHPG